MHTEFYQWDTYGFYGHKKGWFIAYGIYIKSNWDWNMHMLLEITSGDWSCTMKG